MALKTVTGLKGSTAASKNAEGMIVAHPVVLAGRMREHVLAIRTAWTGTLAWRGTALGTVQKPAVPIKPWTKIAGRIISVWRGRVIATMIMNVRTG